MRPIAGAIAVVALAAACGGGSGSGFPTVNGHPDPTAIAAKLHCVGYTRADAPIELFAATEGDCDAAGGSVTILTFASSDAMSHWKQAGTEIAGNTGTIVFGDQWAVEAADADQAAALKGAAEGHPVAWPTYPAVVAQSFLRGCESSAPVSFCECNLQWLERHVPLEQIHTATPAEQRDSLDRAKSACSG